jgi:hypothetical protein
MDQFAGLGLFCQIRYNNHAWRMFDRPASGGEESPDSR